MSDTLTASGLPPRAALAWPCFLLLLFKLWLVHDREIVAVDNIYDQVRYARMAESLGNMEWLGAYDRYTLLRRPGYPLWIALVRPTGLPLRIASEVLLALGAFSIARAFSLTSLPRWLAVVAYAGIVFHPQGFALHDQMLSDGFYTAALAVLVAGLVRLIGERPPSLVESTLTGLALAWLWHTRPEDAYLAGCFGTAAVLALVLRRRMPRDWLARRLGPALAVPLLCLLTVTIAVRSLNLARYGVFVSHEMFAPGFIAAHGELARIEPVAPRRFVSIPTSSRSAAYAVSPSFRTLQPYLEGTLREGWTIDSCAMLQVCDDYANGWFVFALRDATALAGHYRSASETDAFYGRVAAELAQACAEGRLPCGALPWSYLPPRPRSYLPFFPGSLAKTAGLFFFSSPVSPALDPADAPEDVRSLFDGVANRRRGLTVAGSVSVVGWTFAPSGHVTAVALQSGDGRTLASTSSFLPRPDVASHFAERGLPGVPVNTGFVLVGLKPTAGRVLPSARLAISQNDGSTRFVPVDPVVDAGADIRYAVDVREETASPAGISAFVRETLATAHPRLLVILIGFGVVGPLLSLLLGLRPSAEVTAVVLLLAFVVGARMALVALIGASSFQIEARYVHPVAGLLTVLLLVVTRESAEQLDHRLRRHVRNGEEPALGGTPR